VGDPAPDFEAEAVFDQEFIKVRFRLLPPAWHSVLAPVSAVFWPVVARKPSCMCRNAASIVPLAHIAVRSLPLCAACQVKLSDYQKQGKYVILFFYPWTSPSCARRVRPYPVAMLFCANNCNRSR